MWLGVFEPNPVWEESLDPDLVFGLYDLDWDVMAPFVDRMVELMPKMADVGFRTAINGPESFTPDGNPLMGEHFSVKGLFLNCAMNSRGVQMSGRFTSDLKTCFFPRWNF